MCKSTGRISRGGTQRRSTRRAWARYILDMRLGASTSSPTHPACIPRLQCPDSTELAAEVRSAGELLSCAGWSPALTQAAGNSIDRINQVGGSKHVQVAACVTGLPPITLQRTSSFGNADVFVHTAIVGTSPHAVLTAIMRLRPTAWRIFSWRFRRNTATCAEAACDSEDPSRPTRSGKQHSHAAVGCYDQLRCSRCRTHKYLPMLLRRWLCWRLVEHYEAVRRARYSLVVYARTDGLESPRCWDCGSRQALRELHVEINTVRTSQLRAFGDSVPSDNGAVMARDAAPRYFSSVLETGRCQLRTHNERICGVGTWGVWASPECLLKIHLLRNSPECAVAPSRPAFLASVPLSRASYGPLNGSAK